MPHRATHDAAQDIAGALVRGADALRDQEGGGTGVVGHHLVAEALGLHRLGIVAQVLAQAGDDRLEEIGAVVRLDPLDGARDALQPHPGIDALERKGREGAVRRAVELHEDQVPDLEPARAGLRVVRHAFGTLAELGAPIEVDLAAGPARPGVGHLPEVVVIAALDVTPARQALGWQTDLIGPDPVGIIVKGVGRRRQSLGRDAQLGGQELPRPVDRLALEVVAEAPVAQHLEEGLVARRPPNLLEVVVPAGNPQARLCVDCTPIVTRFLSGEHRLERDHPRVDEEEGGVVTRDEGRRRHARVAALLEEALEALPDLCPADRLHIPWSVLHSRREPATTGSRALRSSTVMRVTRQPPRAPFRPRQPAHRTRPPARRAPARRRRAPR